MPAIAARVSLDQARAFWFARQALAVPAPAGEPAADVVARTGWVRTVGGAEGYIAAHARRADGAGTRAELDAAAARRDLVLTPAVRGCIYIVPRRDAGLALAVAADQARGRTVADAAKAGVTAAELADVGAAVVDALAGGPLTTDGVRRALPDGVVRGLGEAGKRAGVSSPLPPALRLLEFDGRIVRQPEGDRLDTERYRWRLAGDGAMGDGAAVGDGRGVGGGDGEGTTGSAPADRAALAAALAARFFAFAGPASRDDFAAWSGLTKRDADAAVTAAAAAHGLAPVAVDGYAEVAWLPAVDLDDLTAAGPGERVALLGFEDNFTALHGPIGTVVAPRHHDVVVAQWGRLGPTRLGEARHAHQRAIVSGGAVAGWWAYDPAAGAVVTATFEPLPPAQTVALARAADDVGRLLRDDVGHGRMSSIDSEAAVAERAAGVRAMAGGGG